VKKIIEWVDSFYAGISGGTVRVSQVHDLVSNVRVEALGNAELIVRRLVTNPDDNTHSAQNLRQAADEISALRKLNTGPSR
jgi:hypothetical protein